MELQKVLDAQARAWEEFKTATDAKLAAIESKQSTSDHDAKIAKINAQLDEYRDQVKALQAAAARTEASDGPTDAGIKAHSKAFNQFMRKGNNEGELRDLERKNNVNITTAADGGYALPEVTAREIGRLMVDVSPMREVSRVITVSSNDYRELFDKLGITSGWVGEAAARPATNTPALTELPAFMGEIYANPQATQASLEDLFFNVEGWLAESVAEEFAKQEGAAFVSGDGTNKPKGFLGYTFVATADSSRTFGQCEYVPTGVAGDWAASNKADVIMSLIYKLKKAHRKNAVFMTNKALLAEIRQFKDTTGQYLWQPSLSASQPESLAGYGVVENEDMPAKAASSLSLAFGNFKAGYTIVDRVGVTTLRDPFTNKPYVGFYSRKRVGGMLRDSDAIKAVKFSVS